MRFTDKTPIAAAVLLGGFALPAAAQQAPCTVPDSEQVRHLRLNGGLEQAETLVRDALACAELEAGSRLDLELELTQILDRQALHANTRPVTEVLEILTLARERVGADDPGGRARLVLALAEYHYRAEMAERRFPLATRYGEEAEALFRQLGDRAGQADAVHRLGLIEFQKRNLEAARELFERSLELSPSGPDRLLFLADYHRHTGFVDTLSGDLPAAIDHYRQSLDYREQAGSTDHALFARITLGSALTDAGRAIEGLPHLERALTDAVGLPSPVAEMRASYYLGETLEKLDRPDAALDHFRRALELAGELGVGSFMDEAEEAVARLSATDKDDPA